MALQPAIPIDASYARVTMFITTTSKTVSEVHWLVTPGTSAQDGLTAGSQLAALRSAMLCGDGKIIEVRCSLENVFRDSLVDATTADLPPTGFEPENVGNDCLKARFEGTSLYRRIAYLGAIPDDCITKDGYVPGANVNFNKALKLFFTSLGGTPSSPNIRWGFLVINKNPGVAPVCQIANMQGTAGSNTVTVQTKQAHLLANLDVVRLSRVPNASATLPFNQLWQVLVTDATTFQILNFPTLPALLIKGPGGTAQKQIKTIQRYTSAQLDGVGTRKRGGRAFLPLGRSKKKRTIGY